MKAVDELEAKEGDYWDGGIPWVGIKDARVHHGKIITETFQTVTQDGLDNSYARLLPKDMPGGSDTSGQDLMIVGTWTRCS